MNDILQIILYLLGVVTGMALMGIGGAFLLLWIDKKRKEKEK